MDSLPIGIPARESQPATHTRGTFKLSQSHVATVVGPVRSLRVCREAWSAS
jgi:hypothetical protein